MNSDMNYRIFNCVYAIFFAGVYTWGKSCFRLSSEWLSFSAQNFNSKKAKCGCKAWNGHPSMWWPHLIMLNFWHLRANVFILCYQLSVQSFSLTPAWPGQCIHRSFWRFMLNTEIHISLLAKLVESVRMARMVCHILKQSGRQHLCLV